MSSNDNNNGPDKTTGQFHSAKGTINETVSLVDSFPSSRHLLTNTTFWIYRSVTSPVLKTGNSLAGKSMLKAKRSTMLLVPRVTSKVPVIV